MVRKLPNKVNDKNLVKLLPISNSELDNIFHTAMVLKCIRAYHNEINTLFRVQKQVKESNGKIDYFRKYVDDFKFKNSIINEDYFPKYVGYLKRLFKLFLLGEENSTQFEKRIFEITTNKNLILRFDNTCIGFKSKLISLMRPYTNDIKDIHIRKIMDSCVNVFVITLILRGALSYVDNNQLNEFMSDKEIVECKKLCTLIYHTSYEVMFQFCGGIKSMETEFKEKWESSFFKDINKNNKKKESEMYG